jgi:ABC-2 type transport system ATP-binding protein
MSQRLGIAGALLGDPGILLFDEPVNGLDPEGIRWIRDFFRVLAKEGRTVFVSSHLMSEMAVSADQIIVIGRGKFITAGSVNDLTATAKGTVFIRTGDPARLSQVLTDAHAMIEQVNEASLSVSGITSDQVGQAAFAAGIVLFELTPQRASLEDVFMDLTADSLEYGHQSTEPPE